MARNPPFGGMHCHHPMRPLVPRVRGRALGYLNFTGCAQPDKEIHYVIYPNYGHHATLPVRRQAAQGGQAQRKRVR